MQPFIIAHIKKQTLYTTVFHRPLQVFSLL